jgi:hypothetical protein
MRRILPPRFAVFTLLVLWCQGAHTLVQAQEDAFVTDPVSIVLFPQAVSDDALISLGQVAELSGGPDSLRIRLKKLDITEFKLDAAHVAVSQEQVRFRLLLAGIDASRFRLLGARRTIIVASDEPVTRRTILAAADHKLRERYPGDVSSVTITPNNGIVVPVIKTEPGDQVRFEAKVKGPAAYAGRIRVDVSIMVNGKTREVVPVSLEISVPEAAPSNAAGAKQGPRPANALTSAADPKDVLIKSHDNVRIIANIGSARIEATGEAMEDGRAGQVIRVRNVESNRIVRGRVETAGIVQAEY